MSGEPERHVAFVVEDWDDETERLAARFSVTVQVRGEADGGFDGPRDVPLEEALAWARERATVVYVQLGGQRWSAGSESRVEQGIDQWPEGQVVHPRPPGTPLDGSVQRRDWRLRALVKVPGRGVTEAVVARLREELRGERGVGEVIADRLEDDGIHVLFDIDERSAGAALRGSDPRLAAALRRAGIDGSAARIEVGDFLPEPPPY
ncbi:hypothetical protein Q5424_27985 [Conexibacter sp. JD483]|uniref:hypothetical protein n=1 Tax=unclassified Conexibacter TaxID=2627773 RepID=UPI002716D77A|nr:MULTISPECIES: hypothetical protein [unclassified Conexibacter]MDO8187247.1 hypothetical protein [Conexibacter sp. CPCC 205706]MDO8199344.1 hypothetical protein [Conexibacter sp. CPCC 205762]MDR9372972.1 hypothetical protein [Conexibacter sp. JD483]